MRKSCPCERGIAFVEAPDVCIIEDAARLVFHDDIHGLELNLPHQLYSYCLVYKTYLLTVRPHIDSTSCHLSDSPGTTPLQGMFQISIR